MRSCMFKEVESNIILVGYLTFMYLTENATLPPLRWCRFLQCMQAVLLICPPWDLHL